MLTNRHCLDRQEGFDLRYSSSREKQQMFSYLPFSIIAPLVLALSHNPVSASPYDHGKITAEDLATEKVYSPYVGRAYPDQAVSYTHLTLPTTGSWGV